MKLTNKFTRLASSAVLSFGLAVSSHVLAEDGGDDSGKSTYVHIKPSLVTNVVSPSGRLHFIKADIALRVRGSATAEAVAHHDPLLKNRLVMLLSGQDLEAVRSHEGRADLRAAALEELSMALEEEEAANDIVEVLFTNFLIE